MPNGPKDLSSINPYIDGINKKPSTTPVALPASPPVSAMNSVKSVSADTGFGDWPVSKFAFEVNVGGTDGEIAFQAMDGLGTSIAMMEYRDGNSQNFFKQRRPTITSFDNVTLKKGMLVGDKRLFNWYKQVSSGSFFGDLRTVTIDLIEWSGSSKNVIFKWTLDKAFVVKFTPSSLDGEAEGEVAVEELELAYQSFTMDESTGGGLLSAIAGALGF